ncbi:MAG: hypothetical protein IBJ07_14435 [Rhizobiaceae bacterium]|nr:hypothetical protein [Rhizobiaceae bacterium]
MVTVMMHVSLKWTDEQIGHYRLRTKRRSFSHDRCRGAGGTCVLWQQPTGKEFDMQDKLTTWLWFETEAEEAARG